MLILMIGFASSGSERAQADNTIKPIGLIPPYIYSILQNAASHYPQQAYLKASNPNDHDEFGSAVAIDGDTIVIGAPNEDGSQENSGAAYVFVRAGAGWEQQAYLKPSIPRKEARFGSAVAIDGETIVVGAPFDSTNGSEAGTAFVFSRTGETWTQKGFLFNQRFDSGDNFGFSVAISDDVIVVGAPGESSASRTDQEDDSKESAGAAFIFIKDAFGNWSQSNYLKAFNPSEFDLFGFSVAIDGNTVVVGAPFKDEQTTLDSGAAYIFTFNGTDWVYVTTLLPYAPYEEGDFGHSVNISGDKILVGTPGDSSSASGVYITPPDPDDVSLDHAGAAYIFTRNGNNWLRSNYLKALNPVADTHFGSSVDVDAATAIVGAHRQDSRKGALHVFSLTNTAWSYQIVLKASHRDEDDYFGESASVSGDLIIVGARWEDGNDSGTNGNPANNQGTHVGAGYVFQRFEQIFIPLILR